MFGLAENTSVEKRNLEKQSCTINFIDGSSKTINFDMYTLSGEDCKIITFFYDNKVILMINISAITYIEFNVKLSEK